MSEFEMSVGDASIVALTDMNCAYPTPLPELWPKVAADEWQPFREIYPDTFEGDKMRLEIGCYLVRSSGKTILIDTGYGPGPIEYIGGLRGQLMADLTSNRVSPEDIDIVFLSHLHLDHVGWNTEERDGQNVPMFPNARYVVHEDDLTHFRKPEVQEAGRYPYVDTLVDPLDELGVSGYTARRLGPDARSARRSHSGTYAGPYECHGLVGRTARADTGRCPDPPGADYRAVLDTSLRRGCRDC